MRVAVIGTGLIGGSIGLAAHKYCDAEVAGFDLDQAALRLAKEQGAITVLADSIEKAVQNASVVIVATALSTTKEVVEAVLRFADQTALVTDTGSVKSFICDDVSDQRFIGGHPLAGSELCGVGAARADMFHGATWYLTPTKNVKNELLERAHQLIRQIGASPQIIDPQGHDRIIATVSHLPHILANVLATSAASQFQELDQIPVQGPSLRDMTRVAGANPEMWASIYRFNQDALLATIDRYMKTLSQARQRVANSTRSELIQWQQDVASQRSQMLNNALSSDSLTQLQVAVTNKPGSVAEIALALAKAKISILDMSLQPAAKEQAGSVTVWIDQSDRHAAIETLAALDKVVKDVQAIL